MRERKSAKICFNNTELFIFLYTCHFFYVFIPLLPRPLKHPSPSLCFGNSLYMLGFLWKEEKESKPTQTSLRKKEKFIVRILGCLMKQDREEAAQLL